MFVDRLWVGKAKCGAAGSIRDLHGGGGGYQIFLMTNTIKNTHTQQKCQRQTPYIQLFNFFKIHNPCTLAGDVLLHKPQ